MAKISEDEQELRDAVQEWLEGGPDRPYADENVVWISLDDGSVCNGQGDCLDHNQKHGPQEWVEYDQQDDYVERYDPFKDDEFDELEDDD